MKSDSLSASEQSPPREPLARNAGLTGIATLTSRILGLVRDQTLAAAFGAGDAMDAFVVAFRIPNLVRDLFAEGAMSAAFVPTFTREFALHGKDAAWRLGNNAINGLLVTTGALVVAGILFAHPLITLYAGSFARVPGKLELTAQLTRVVLPFLPMVAVAAAAMGMLNSLHHYFVPALAPAMFNVATIVGVVTLVPVMTAIGWPPIMAVAIAALAGGVGQLAIQWPSLRREGFRYRVLLDPSSPALRRVLMLMGPGTIGLAATQVNLFVNTLLATSQGTGAASWLTYAFRLMYLPIGLFGVSIGTAVLPAVSRHATAGDVAAMRRTISRGLGLMLMLNVPATIGLIVLATPIVQLLFERGRFVPADTAATAAAVRCYAIGLAGYSAVRIASPAFYAIGESRTPAFVSGAVIAINVVASVLLVRAMGFAGLALGTSIAAMANAAVLLWLLRARLGGLDDRRLLTTLARVTVSAIAMAAVAFTLQAVMERVAPGDVLTRRAGRLTISIGGALAALALGARLLHVDEFEEVASMVFGRVRKLLGV
ncbi:MAG TPA: murein biosynthesis integral membrane protein MurJ [Vicinamibacterales bacterium]|nr:murein biosynthesis integral membrane protein MurJ [Vicinamibacterales bacterium]